MKAKPIQPSRTSASPRRRFGAEAGVALQRFQALLADEAMARWAVADALVELVDGHGFLISDLAERFGRRRNTLSAYYHTAQTFPKNQRDLSISFASYDNARQAGRRFDFDPFWCLQQIVIEGLTQRRDVSRFFAQKKRDIDAARSVTQAGQLFDGSDQLINRCHLQNCRLITQKMPDHSIKLANLDLPYGPYSHYSDGVHERHGLTRAECDGNDEAVVMALLDDMLRLLEPKMTTGGVALLYRPGGFHDPLYSVIEESADRYGWSVEHVLTWDKRRTKLARPDAPYSSRTETIYVLARDGDQLVNHDDSSRDNIVSIPAARYRRGEEMDHHLFEKPVALCEYLIGKHTHPNELVFDACGCSGNFSIAAATMDRRFVYCETNPINFEWGSQRIAHALASTVVGVY